MDGRLSPSVLQKVIFQSGQLVRHHYLDHPARLLVYVFWRRCVLIAALGMKGCWSDLDMQPKQVIALYRDHATSEQ